MDPWTNVALYAALPIGLGAVLIGLNHLLAPQRPKPEKNDPYECGVPVLAGTRDRFSVHFYLVAILFILFDIETVFMIPYALLYKKLGAAGLVEMGLFVGVLVFGLAYLWKRGALEWD
jgi:NADH-quinone oxidoreductase subunit A